MNAYEHESAGIAALKPVWIVDDDRSIRWVLEKALAREGIAYQSFSSAYEVLQALASSQPQVLVSDIRMPGESGLLLLNKVKERYPQLPVIIMTAYSDLESAVSAFQGGAYEYLPKPFDVDHALALIRRATTEAPAGAVAEPAGESPEMLGQAPSMQEVFRAIGRLAQLAAFGVLFLLVEAELFGSDRPVRQHLDDRGRLLQHFRVSPARQHAGEPSQEVDDFLVLVRWQGRGRHAAWRPRASRCR